MFGLNRRDGSPRRCSGLSRRSLLSRRFLMSRHNLFARRPFGASDAGGVTVIVAVVVGCCVLTGTAAIAIDVGQLYTEREELQSGADAAVLAVAKNCSTGTCTNAMATAQQYVNKNASDGTSDVTVCGSGFNGISPCVAQSSTSLAACLRPAPTDGSSYIEVRTSTRTKAGGTKISPVFAKGMLGNSAYDGTRVGACSRVAVGKSGRVWEANAIALTVWVCYWSMYTKNGSSWVGYNSTVSPSQEQILYIKDNRANGGGENNTTYCVEGPAGKAAPGNWGWLDSDNDCKAVFTTGSYFGGDPGNGNRADCRALLDTYYAAKTPMMLPLYDDVQGNGNNVTFHIAGYGAFVVTGYSLTGGSKASWLSGKDLCSGSQRCIYGYFTHANFTTDVLKTENGTDFGAVASGGARITA